MSSAVGWAQAAPLNVTYAATPMTRDFPPRLQIPDAACLGLNSGADEATAAHLDLPSPGSQRYPTIIQERLLLATVEFSIVSSRSSPLLALRFPSETTTAVLAECLFELFVSDPVRHVVCGECVGRSSSLSTGWRIHTFEARQASAKLVRHARWGVSPSRQIARLLLIRAPNPSLTGRVFFSVHQPQQPFARWCHNAYRLPRLRDDASGKLHRTLIPEIN